MRIFISYRRDDTEGYAGRLYDRLRQHFGSENLFMDIGTLKPGQDFVVAIEEAVSSCDVLIALIGERWLGITDEEGRRRLDNPQDFVRLEIGTALKREVWVVPMLVRGVNMPRTVDLPDDLAKLARRQALTVDAEHFHADMDRLIETIEEAISPAERELSPPRGGPKPIVWAGMGAGVVALLVGILELADVFGGSKYPVEEQTAPEVEITEEPASTPLPTGTSIPLGFSGNPVRTNDEWTPETQYFDDVEMALVPTGCFIMGSEEGDSDETPVHVQCIAEPFWIDVYEVTNAQYGSEGSFSGPDRPREGVNWFEAVAHCESRGARLPTEAEWEYAARGPDGLMYPWGNSFDGSLANFCDINCTYDWRDMEYDDGYEKTSPVGSFRDGAAWVGAFDMSGNVWEWVNSIYEPYPYDASDGRESDDVKFLGSARVLRDGSWGNSAYNLRAANRDWRDPDSSDGNFGFRCARSLLFSDLVSDY